MSSSCYALPHFQQPPAILNTTSTDATAMAMFRMSLDPILVAGQNHIAG
jgi:hypothetical protein